MKQSYCMYDINFVLVILCVNVIYKSYNTRGHESTSGAAGGAAWLRVSSLLPEVNPPLSV